MEGAVCLGKVEPNDATIPEVASGWRQEAGGDSHSPDLWGFTQPPGNFNSISGCPTLALAPTHFASPFTSVKRAEHQTLTSNELHSENFWRVV